MKIVVWLEESCKMPRQPRLPIVYWLKKADVVLTKRIDEIQQNQGLSRTDWQLLNSLYELGTATRDRLAERLQPFVYEAGLDDALFLLSQRGLIEVDAATSRFCLTTTGLELHEAALTAQQVVRQRAVQGISESDYLTTVRTLQQLVENLENPVEKKALSLRL